MPCAEVGDARDHLAIAVDSAHGLDFADPHGLERERSVLAALVAHGHSLPELAEHRRDERLAHSQGREHRVANEVGERNARCAFRSEGGDNVSRVRVRLARPRGEVPGSDGSEPAQEAIEAGDLDLRDAGRMRDREVIGQAARVGQAATDRDPRERHFGNQHANIRVEVELTAFRGAENGSGHDLLAHRGDVHERADREGLPGAGIGHASSSVGEKCAVPIDGDDRARLVLRNAGCEQFVCEHPGECGFGADHVKVLASIGSPSKRPDYRPRLNGECGPEHEPEPGPERSARRPDRASPRYSAASHRFVRCRTRRPPEHDRSEIQENPHHVEARWGFGAGVILPQWLRRASIP